MGIRAIERVLDVLEELNRHPVSTIAELHRATGLPKPTLVRILQTLEEKGYVDNDPRLGGYQVTAQVASLSGGYHKEPMVVEAGRPWAVALTRQHQWPISIALYENASIIVRFSTIPDSAISPFHRTVNMRLPILTRGLGRAYFAFAPQDEQDLIVSILQRSDDPEDRVARAPAKVAAMVEEVRAQGYATRPEEVLPKNSDTIAVPVFSPAGRVIASLGMTYFRSAFPSVRTATARYAPLLKKASAEITVDLERLAKATGGD
ncbi:DNA-binding transcriptional regulator [Pseudooceanicola sp. 200-1SW]|uniref:DNA-binding transcriptional regulator n=1 Tax=Pseudooceanicola sp. 200-1SW TaxID=3425949 RepID=UPI003D7FA210